MAVKEADNLLVKFKFKLAGETVTDVTVGSVESVHVYGVPPQILYAQLG